MTYEGRQRKRLTATVTDLDVVRQKAMLISVELPGTPPGESDRSIDELARLTDTAGSDPVHLEIVRRPAPDPALFIGSGRADELAMLSQTLDVDVVVFDNDLTPAQQRNLQKKFSCDVVDRVGLILDIFAQHATSREGMLQVELALLKYTLPRLSGQGITMSRQAGRIGGRGPGETKLETDRRRIQHRVAKLSRELKELSSTRSTQRKSRRKSDLPLVALVGYTNAGKSTLLNRLAQSEVLTEDRLFSTLGSTVRRTELTPGEPVLMSDTVGFVRRLPHELIEAFRSTLEEILDADLTVHVVDASDPYAEDQIAAVREVLEEIDAHKIPELLVFNKTDDADPIAVKRLLALYPDSLSCSALTGNNTQAVAEAIVERLRGATVQLELFVPYDQPSVLAQVHRDSDVSGSEHNDTGTTITTRVHASRVHEFDELLAD